MVEYPIPEEQKPKFNFVQMATAVRMNGFFMADNLYINHAYIVGMSFQTDETAAPAVRRDLN